MFLQELERVFKSNDNLLKYYFLLLLEQEAVCKDDCSCSETITGTVRVKSPDNLPSSPCSASVTGPADSTLVVTFEVFNVS